MSPPPLQRTGPDDYFLRLQPDMRPLVEHIRRIFLDTCPRLEESITWLTEAKREATRLKRLEQALAWLKEGKSRNGKYK